MMMAHNLCHSTISATAKEQEKNWTNVEGRRVASPANRAGVLPDLLHDLQKKRADRRKMLRYMPGIIGFNPSLEMTGRREPSSSTRCLSTVSGI